MLILLDQRPVHRADLADWLQMPESNASGLLKALVRAGVTELPDRGACRAAGPPEAVLNRVARAGQDPRNTTSCHQGVQGEVQEVAGAP